ncbi:hypothetical protein IBX73_09195 [candidate division WOR-3 bacterium]|nr:hypothetical protein [candidate division WOR-3 bacterium]
MTIAGLLCTGLLFGADFVICTVDDFQDYPAVEYADGQYYVFWTDRRFYSLNERFAIYGARVSQDGHVIDQNGKLIFCDSTAEAVGVAYDMSNFFVVARNHC